MSDLVEFVKARLADVEQVARAAVSFDYGVKDWADDGDPVNIHIARWDPTRVLAELEAKWLRLGQIEHELADDPTDETAMWRLRVEALPYADHPDYREEWRP